MRSGIGPASVFEMIWTIIAAIGAVHLAYLWWQALQDEWWLKTNNINGVRSIMARMTVRAEFTAFMVMICFFGLGVAAMLIPARTSDGEFRWYPFIAALAFMSLAIMKDLDAILRRRERRQVFAMEARRVANERAETAQ